MSERSGLGEELAKVIAGEGNVYLGVGRRELPLTHPDVPPQRLAAFYKTKIDQWLKGLTSEQQG
jgi:hypothetical protein